MPDFLALPRQFEYRKQDKTFLMSSYDQIVQQSSIQAEFIKVEKFGKTYNRPHFSFSKFAKFRPAGA